MRQRRSALLPVLLVALCGMALFGAPAFAASADDALLRKVDQHYNRLSSLRCHFVEHYAGMGIDRSEQGTLLLKKPGQMRWSYDQPPGKLFVLDGKYAWFYTPGDVQAERIPAKQMDDLRSPLRFLLGHTRLKRELEAISVTPGTDGFRIRGVPRGMEQRVKSLRLGVSAAGEIRSMRIEEVDGAVTSFQFSDIQDNVPVSRKDFAFTPPPGVTVVEGLPPV